MHGSWVIVRTRREGGSASWMLIKHRDEAAVPGNTAGPSPMTGPSHRDGPWTRSPAGKGRRAKPFMTASGSEAGAVWQSNRNDGQAAGSPPLAAPKSPRAEAKRKTAGSLPPFIEPQLAKSVAKPPAGPGWAHEIKFDGYRMQLRIDRRQSHPCSRARASTGRANSRRSSAAGADLDDGIIDGEVVALDHTGAPDFAALQAAISDGKTKDLVFFVFDQMFAGSGGPAPAPPLASARRGCKQRSSRRRPTSAMSIIS